MAALARVVCAVLLVAATASAQGSAGRVEDECLTLLVTEPKSPDVAAVAAAAERAFGVKRVRTMKEFEAARDTSCYVGATEVGFRVWFRRRVFRVRGAGEPAMNEVSASFQEERIRGAIRSHKGLVEVHASDLTTPEIPKAETILGREEEERAIAVRAAKRAEEMGDELCKLTAQFFDQKPSAVYRHGTNWLFLADDMIRDWLTKPRAMSRLASAGGAWVHEAPRDDRAMESAMMKARAGWSRFVGFLGRRAGADFRVLVAMEEEGRSEFVWIAVTKADSARLVGTIAHEPLTLKARKGDEIEAGKAQVRDWTFRNGEKSEGGFLVALVR